MDNQREEFEQMMMDYLKGSLKPEEKQRFLEMLQGNEEYRQRYRELSRVYALATASWFIQRKASNLDELREKLNLRSSRRHTLRRLWRWSAAAVWTCLIIGGLTLWNWNHRSSSHVEAPSYCQIEIPQGATSRVLLPDSTVVVLNGGTQLKYNTQWQSQRFREVFLSGEAYFQVAKDETKPFVVHADDLHIKVLGTIFNVASYPEEESVKVSLLEGKVNVYMASETQHNCFLYPNQQAVYQKEKGILSVQEVDAARQAAWTTGKLIFINERLYDILKTIEKKYDVHLLIQSKKVYEEYFSGSIQLGMTLDEILSYLDVDNKFMWKKKGKTLVILDR